MVAGALPAFSDGNGGAKGMLPVAVSPSNKCRYKTGKCSNVRSAKRNGQPHQLCLYHRDKANQIQRKFDRQKRQVARVRKMTTSNLRKTHMTMLDAATPTNFAALHAHEVEIYSDSDSSRFSTDSESSVILDQLWQDLPKSAYTYDAEPTVSATEHAMEATEPVTSENQGHLSYDEIDFLCSAMLE
ncbi:TPA: hypothetical protein N0F65_004702 [Lagenidium giganteum]|uniref:Uncharacterized protein n=1 Tax=Lagenidium giganteum TaxID=4803 RepID=A0AAV2Z4Y1_9STRA|nr:TPA: hypothetical protein N0F65_004702 [Lagenidium giganteum]